MNETPQKKEWFPRWALQFLAGAFLAGSLAWAGDTNNRIRQTQDEDRIQSAEIAVLKQMAADTHAELTLIHSRQDQVLILLNEQIAKDDMRHGVSK